MTCQHDNIACGLGFGRVLKSEAEPVLAYFAATININCKDCGMAFEFVGLPLGASPYRPTVSMDGLTLTAPLVEPGKTVPEGLPSLAVSMTTGESN